MGDIQEVVTWIFVVATWLGAGQEKRCRDPVLRSRPGLALRPSRRDFNVATWASGCRKDPCHDIILRSRHRRSGWDRLRGRVATSAHLACARPGFWVCALCTQPSFGFRSLLGSLFMDTVHRDKKKV